MTDKALWVQQQSMEMGVRKAHRWNGQTDQKGHGACSSCLNIGSLEREWRMSCKVEGFSK